MSEATKLIEQVAAGADPHKLIEAENNLAAVDPALAKVRKQAMDKLRDTIDLIDKIGREVTVRDIMYKANRIASDLTTYVTKLNSL